MHLFITKNLSIFEQLQLEEALLRTDTQNYCLINVGSPPAIVMGISQDSKLVVNRETHQQNPVPLIRRFSGGGTVVVEPSTVFFTLIVNHDNLPVKPFPKEVLGWTEKLIRPAFQGLPFALRENDYVLGEKKCAGNAQYFTKGRCLHHTTFLWDYTPALMDLLLHPPKEPSYRQNRPHSDFLCTLKPYFRTQEEFTGAIQEALSGHFKPVPVTLEEARHTLERPHRKSTVRVG